MVRTSLGLGASVLVALFGSVVSAQSARVLPPLAETLDGNSASRYPFGFASFRIQQVIDGSALATASATLTSLQLRADNDASQASSASTVQQVVLEASHTSVTPTTVATMFAANVTGTPTTVFAGPLNLPAYTPSPGAVAPFGVTMPFSAPFPLSVAQGNLLLDLRASNPGIGNPFTTDVAVVGGAIRRFGTAGMLALPDVISLTVASPATFSGLVPGGRFRLRTGSLFRPRTGWMLLGFAARSQGLPIPGAPGNELWIDLDAAYRFAMQAAPTVGYQADWPLLLPADPALTGTSIYAQSVLDDPANALGLTVTDARDLVIGFPGPHPIQQLQSNSATAATGFFESFSASWPSSAVVRIGGTFR